MSVDLHWLPLRPAVTPSGSINGASRGVIAEGPVGSRWAQRFRIFRYEIRRWRDGVIADVGEAVDSTQRPTVARVPGAGSQSATRMSP